MYYSTTALRLEDSTLTSRDKSTGSSGGDFITDDLYNDRLPMLTTWTGHTVDCGNRHCLPFLYTTWLGLGNLLPANNATMRLTFCFRQETATVL